MNQAKLSFYFDSLCKIAGLIGIQTKSAFNNISLIMAYMYFNVLGTSNKLLTEFIEPLIQKSSDQCLLYNYFLKVIECVACEIDDKKVVVD